TWWQTETGAIMNTPLPGITATKPGSATVPFPGIEAEVLSANGEPATAGYLAITKPWPGMLRTVWGDDERFRDTYWSHWGGRFYFPGDGGERYEDGLVEVLCRVAGMRYDCGHR